MKFSLRELLFVVFIVGLTISWLRDRRENLYLRQQNDALRSLAENRRRQALIAEDKVTEQQKELDGMRRITDDMRYRLRTR